MKLALLATDVVSALCAQMMSADVGHPLALDLTEAALLESDPAAEQARLRTRGFVRGRLATWRSGDESLAFSVTLYRLGSAAHAEVAVDDTMETLRAAAARMGMVGGMQGAALRDQPDEGADGPVGPDGTEVDGAETFVVTFSVGPTHAVVLLSGAPVAVLAGLARAQRDLLSTELTNSG